MLEEARTGAGSTSTRATLDPCKLASDEEAGAGKATDVLDESAAGS